jgi:hypothetical protein
MPKLCLSLWFYCLAAVDLHIRPLCSLWNATEGRAGALWNYLQALPSSVQFLNFPRGLDFHKTDLGMTATRHAPAGAARLTWAQIDCTETHRVGQLDIKTNCRNARTKQPYARDDPRRHKVFVQGFTDLASYVRAIQRGSVRRRDHMALWRRLEGDARRLDCIITNHNLDVALLHFKLRPR